MRHRWSGAAFGALVGVLVSPLQALSWNKAGHMVTAAIAYRSLELQDPRALGATIDLLKLHPEYETRWLPRLQWVDASERDLYLFMLAARWPDDIRGDEDYDVPRWHFINLPFRVGPGSMPNAASPNILEGLKEHWSSLKAKADDFDSLAASLCWLFHLMGDIHQPLHAATLFSDRFAEGDRGGTRFYVRVAPNSRTLSLHQLWDGMVIGSERFRNVRNKATELRSKVSEPTESVPAEFDALVQESLALAKSRAYRQGELAGSTSEENGSPLPSDYISTETSVAERRIAEAGYRLARRLADAF